MRIQNKIKKKKIEKAMKAMLKKAMIMKKILKIEK